MSEGDDTVTVCASVEDGSAEAEITGIISAIDDSAVG